MSRPIRNNVDYIPLDCKESNREMLIRNKFGREGRLCYLMLLRALGDAEFHYYDCSDPDREELLAIKCDTDVPLLIEILNYLSISNRIDKELWGLHKIVFWPSANEKTADVWGKRKRAMPDRALILDIVYNENNREKKPMKINPKVDERLVTINPIIEQNVVSGTETLVSGAETLVSVPESTQSKVKKERKNNNNTLNPVPPAPGLIRSNEIIKKSPSVPPGTVSLEHDMRQPQQNDHTHQKTDGPFYKFNFEEEDELKEVIDLLKDSPSSSSLTWADLNDRAIENVLHWNYRIQVEKEKKEIYSPTNWKKQVKKQATEEGNVSDKLLKGAIFRLNVIKKQKQLNESNESISKELELMVEKVELLNDYRRLSQDDKNWVDKEAHEMAKRICEKDNLPVTKMMEEMQKLNVLRKMKVEDVE